MEILDLKAQGWTDRQIQKFLEKESGLTYGQYHRRLKELRESGVFKMEALNFVNETIHRLSWLRRKAASDYHRHNDPTGKAGSYNANAAAAAFRRMVEIDTSLPKLILDMGWSLEELNSFYSREKAKEITRDTSEAELYEEYREIVKSRA